MNAKLLLADGRSSEIMPKNGKHFSLEECYAIIDCQTIEVVALGDGMMLIVDEEGLLKANPKVNALATQLAREAGTAEGIVGNAIWCPSRMLK